MTDLDRKDAWRNIKSAIRSYAKDPTAQNALEVEEAWRDIRRMDNLLHWREWREARLNARNASDRLSLLLTLSAAGILGFSTSGGRQEPPIRLRPVIAIGLCRRSGWNKRNAQAHVNTPAARRLHAGA